MGNNIEQDFLRSPSTTSVWQATCKDCQAEAAALAFSRKEKGENEKVSCFEYAGTWAEDIIERGDNRSDRCPRHRKEHRRKIQFIAVPYIDLQVIGNVADPNNPAGLLGGLGPLPERHKEEVKEADLEKFKLGMNDKNVLDILESLEQKQVVIVEAGTGTGKSTFMPYRLMNPPKGAKFRPTDMGPIIVTEPRKKAATGVAQFVGEQMCMGCTIDKCDSHFGPGYPVGYQVSGDIKHDSACRLIYVTDGTMINWVREGRLARIGMVIVDEAHERSENIDIILTLLQQQIEIHKHLKVIITSATINTKFFTEYFGGKDKVALHKFKAVKKFGYGVPFFVGIAIDEKIIINGYPIGEGENRLNFEGWEEASSAGSADIEIDLRKETKKLSGLRILNKTIPRKDWKKEMPEILARQIVKIVEGTGYGDILGFLPTTETINKAVELIEKGIKYSSQVTEECDVFPLLASQPENIIKKALGSRKPGEKRKIVVSSNLAETSMTVEGVRYIVDSGLICQEEWDPDLVKGDFPSKPHSQSGLRQRWGRVGRNAPGWVFPLYSITQFLDLPQNTPPGSTQTNLETFSMKLLAAGVSFDDELLLPANYEADGVTPDKEGRRSMELFTKEFKRARKALEQSGAVDRQGHLTDFGRDLERFSMAGTHAIAIMLSDQAACSLETILTLKVLSEGRLNGGESSIFYIDKLWPTAWRVQAAHCHRAFAVGCTDDLDVLLRVYSEWQKKKDHEELLNCWCANWWVNARVLEQVEKDVEECIGSLAVRMKQEAKRQMNPALAGRVRAVLSRALGGLLYIRYGDGNWLDGFTYRSGSSGESENDQLEEVQLSGSTLVDPGEKVIALGGFRPPAGRGGAVRKALISGVVRYLDWASESEDRVDPSDMGFEIVLRSARYLRSSDDVLGDVDDTTSLLRELFPVGTYVDIVWGSNGAISGLKPVCEPFSYGINWQDPKENKSRMVPTENEKPDKLIFIEENNDSGEADKMEPLSKRKTNHSSVDITHSKNTLPDLFLTPRFPQVDLTKAKRAEVVGYQLNSDKEGVLVVDMVEPDTEPKDPALHESLKYGDAVDVEVLGIIRGDKYPLMQLARTDGKGKFYLPTIASGIDYYDKNNVRWLRPGGYLSALVIPGGDEKYTVSLLPEAYQSLSKAKTVKIQGTDWYPGTIVEGINEYHKVMVELDCRDDEKGFIYTFQVGIKEEEEKALGTEKGDRLLLRLNWETETKPNGKELEHKTLSLPSSVDLDDVVTKWTDCVVQYSKKRQTIAAKRNRKKELPVELVSFLVNLNPVEFKWNELVWSFFMRSFHQSYESACPAYPHVVLRLPAGKTGTFIGKHKCNIQDFNNREKVISVHLRPGTNDEVMIVGETDSVVKNMVEEVNELFFPVVGKMTVPMGQLGRIFGSIKEMREVTGCRTQNDDGDFIISGKTESCVLQFIEMSQERADGTTGEIATIDNLEILKDATQSIWDIPSVTTKSTVDYLGDNEKPYYLIERIVEPQEDMDVVISEEEQVVIASSENIDDLNNSSDKAKIDPGEQSMSTPRYPSSGRVRVYTLAKECGVASKAFVEKLISQGYAITGHASTVSGKDAEKIRRLSLGKVGERVKNNKKIQGTPDDTLCNNIEDRFGVEIVSCPICGRNNLKTDTFLCPGCGCDNLCLQHQHDSLYLCSNCISKSEFVDNGVLPVQGGGEEVVESKARLKTSSSTPDNYWLEPITGMEFVWISPGRFEMGDVFGEGSANEQPVHHVNVVGFWLGKYLITQKQWREVMYSNPSQSQKGDDFPVDSVSWEDAQRFIERLNIKGGYSFRLPSEVEWEYAARSAGGKERFSGGDEWKFVAWTNSNSPSSTMPVGKLESNELNLHDMSGNVYEWCLDVWHENYEGAPCDNSAWFRQGVLDTYVLRGGSWMNSPMDARTCARNKCRKELKSSHIGLRIAVSADKFCV